jgi:anti-sigma factor ChrR (cupin superfamily)
VAQTKGGHTVLSDRTILEEADYLTKADRQSSYGDASEDFVVIAGYWSLYLGDRLSELLTDKDVAMMMALLKIRREQHKHKRDNIVDACGYLKLAGNIEGET